MEFFLFIVVFTFLFFPRKLGKWLGEDCTKFMQGWRETYQSKGGSE